jgi:hypothetical protein
VDTTPIGDSRLNLTMRRHALEVEQAKALAEVLLETGAHLDDLRPNPRALANDAQRLRGIPAVGGRGSVGGAMRGTIPHVDGLR